MPSLWYCLVLILILSTSLSVADKADNLEEEQKRIITEYKNSAVQAQTPDNTSFTEEHHVLAYSLPRLGLASNEDCYWSIYTVELERDIAMMRQMGVSTIYLLCPWSTKANSDHKELLRILQKYQMSFIVSLRTTIYQIEKKGGEKEFQEGLFLFADELTKRSEATPLLKGISIQYNLTSETASFFFAFVNKVKFWMQMAGLQVPLLVPWVAQVEDKDVKTQLTQWNSASFDAWVAYLFSPGEIQYFVNQLESASIFKKLFIMYGADSYDMLSNQEDQGNQTTHIETIYNYITTAVQDTNNTIMGSALFSYADIYYASEEALYVFGGSSATCPDNNPWLQTTCGRKLQDNHFGEDSVSVEVMGLFEHYETLVLQRCVKPKKAAQWLIQYWNSSSLTLGDMCVVAFSNPFPWYVMVVPLGMLVPAFIITLALCCLCRSSRNTGASKINANAKSS